MVKNRVLAVLVLAGMAAALGLSFLTHAPNRLVSGSGISLAQLVSDTAGCHIGPWLALLPALLLVAAIFMRPARSTQIAVYLAATLLLAGLTGLAAGHATQLAGQSNPIARTSLGGAFWLLAALGWLAAADAMERLALKPIWRMLGAGAVVVPLLALLAAGALKELSLLKEYANRQDVFNAALWQHVQIVLASLLPALLIGVPLGVASSRARALRPPLFAVLNVIQTVPSIALFALLMAPLALLAASVPALAQLGIKGIGLAPAVIALTLYGLLPVVRSTAAGLSQVPQPVIEAALGMGLTPRQIFWRVELPLALPVFLSGLRVATVQTIGMAVVAALIGAGGFGAIVFQGLLSGAL
ncbi:MAG: ABC transporter permease, partial [Polaromonas sp.]|nr:ABC transporter permease [Polaromonas sp.]